MDKDFKYKYDDLFNPTLKALKNLGGSGSVSEIEEQIAPFGMLRHHTLNGKYYNFTSNSISFFHLLTTESK